MEGVIQNSHQSLGLSASAASGSRAQSLILEHGQKQAKSTNLFFPIKQTKKRESNAFPTTYILLVLKSLWRIYFWKLSNWAVRFVTGKELTWQLHKV